MSVTVFRNSPERMNAVDYSEPLFIDESTILWHNPVIEPDLAGFIKPYKYSVRRPITLIFFMLMLLKILIKNV